MVSATLSETEAYSMNISEVNLFMKHCNICMIYNIGQIQTR